MVPLPRSMLLEKVVNPAPLSMLRGLQLLGLHGREATDVNSVLAVCLIFCIAVVYIVACFFFSILPYVLGVSLGLLYLFFNKCTYLMKAVAVILEVEGEELCRVYLVGVEVAPVTSI